MIGNKKKRVSKKTKISWRKNVNIQDVEDYLEDQRLEERLGPVNTLRDDELFQVDTKPAEVTSPIVLSTKAKKKLRALDPPKCFATLRPHTNVPDPISKRNRVRSKEERRNELIKKKLEKRRAENILTFREQQSKRDRQVDKNKKEAQPKRGDFNINIWKEEEKSGLEIDEWIPKSTLIHNQRGTGKILKKRSEKKKSGNPTIEIPHPGMSYNPSYGDHQELLKMVAEKETGIMKTEEHLDRVTVNMFNKIPAQKRDNSWLEEMSEGLQQPDMKEEKVEADEEEYTAVNPPVQNQKKTIKQRRKKKEQLELQLKAKLAKVEKKKVTDLHRLKMLKQNIEKQEKLQASLKDKREKIKQLKENETKRLGALKYEEPDLDFNMAGELQGSLRNLKTEGSLLRDRYKSLQKRDIVQVSVRRNRNNVKVKKFIKPGHKDDWKKFVARSFQKN